MHSPRLAHTRSTGLSSPQLLTAFCSADEDDHYDPRYLLRRRLHNIAVYADERRGVAWLCGSRGRERYLGWVIRTAFTVRNGGVV